MTDAKAGPRSILKTIGKTPLIRLRHVVPDDCAAVFVKLEAFNPTGSYKDRMALSMIQEAERRGDLRPGMAIVEYTGGSTGSALAFVCAVKGYPFHVVSSNAFANEKLMTMRAYGAHLEIIHSPTGRSTPDLVPAMRERATEIAASMPSYFTNQFTNRDAVVGYEAIGAELSRQLPEGVDAFCGAVGSGGMLMGVSRALKRAGFDARIVALEPASSPMLTEGHAGTHQVDGVGAGFVPPLLDAALYDEARAIDEQEGRAMCRRLAAREGLMAGTSSGLNVVAAIQLAQELGPGKTVVTVACDTGLKYLEGDLYEG